MNVSDDSGVFVAVSLGVALGVFLGGFLLAIITVNRFISSLIYAEHTDIYRVRQIKVIPYRVWLISQQRIGIFSRKFIPLFAIYIYV